ncbi:hypothetical protein BV20DRAFT_940091 [Pilatotrama ljubarskyi]|nr:hypothetical protein BV20DRAFT_940091 [Pilatotrama ljubarskyi]
MHGSAQSLSLPMETAPRAAMSKLSWPRLGHLVLHGRYLANNEPPVLPTLLQRMSALRTLCVQVAQPPSFSRAPILGRTSTNSVDLCGLRSLIIAYPDPEDSIFAVQARNLTYLALRDEPRYYFTRWSPLNTGRGTTQPILKSSECLRILQKMALPRLESLELVYQADAADEDLLQHISSTYAHLARLEQHRYRPDDQEDVPYLAVTKHLASIRTLQSAHLNLDFRETAPIHCIDHRKMVDWCSFRHSRSEEVLAILEAACPKFECLGVLDTRRNCCTWVEYRPSWYPGPHVDVDDCELDRA